MCCHIHLEAQHCVAHAAVTRNGALEYCCCKYNAVCLHARLSGLSAASPLLSPCLPWLIGVSSVVEQNLPLRQSATLCLAQCIFQGSRQLNLSKQGGRVWSAGLMEGHFAAAPSACHICMSLRCMQVTQGLKAWHGNACRSTRSFSSIPMLLKQLPLQLLSPYWARWPRQWWCCSHRAGCLTQKPLQPCGGLQQACWRTSRWATAPHG